MGSFNLRCFVSGQTIAPGEALVVVPIVRQQSPATVWLEHQGKRYEVPGSSVGACYPTDYWRPVGPALMGVYEDYGCLELEKSVPNVEALLSFVQLALSHVPKVRPLDDARADVGFSLAALLDEFSPGTRESLLRRNDTDTLAAFDDALFERLQSFWDALTRVIQEGKLFWIGYAGPQPCNLAVIHRRAFDELVASIERSSNWEGHPLSRRNFFDRALASAESRFKEASKFSSGFASHQAAQRFASTMRGLADWEGARMNFVEDFFLNSCQLHLAGHLSEDGLYQRTLPMQNFVYAMAGLARHNVFFEPMATAGQDYSNAIGAAYASFVKRVSEQVLRGRIEAKYGPFIEYSLCAKHGHSLEKLRDLCTQWDGAFEMVSSEPSPETPLVQSVRFRCTLGLEDVRAMLSEFEASRQEEGLRTWDLKKVVLPQA